jgi:signal peptidase II
LTSGDPIWDMKASESVSNGRLFAATTIGIVLADIVTKALAVATLAVGIPRDLVGGTVRLALVYNPGAAFGINFGAPSRGIFLALTVGALSILVFLYRATRRGDIPRTLAIALVAGGAVGNLIDRIRSPAGVVDFIDVGIRSYRWPTFNVADMAVTTGAILLAWVLWMEDRARNGRPAPVPET